MARHNRGRDGPVRAARPGLLPRLARCAAQRPTAVTRSSFAPEALAVSPAHAPLHQAVFQLCQRVGNDPVAGNPVAGDKAPPRVRMMSHSRNWVLSRANCAADVVLMMPHLRQSPGLPG